VRRHWFLVDLLRPRIRRKAYGVDNRDLLIAQARLDLALMGTALAYA